MRVGARVCACGCARVSAHEAVRACVCVRMCAHVFAGSRTRGCACVREYILIYHIGLSCMIVTLAAWSP